MIPHLRSKNRCHPNTSPACAGCKLPHVLELASSDHPDIARQLDGKLKRVQFDTLPEFSESLDNICSLLDTTRREFLERAMMDAIFRAEAAFLAAYKEATGQDYADSSVVSNIPEA